MGAYKSCKIEINLSKTVQVEVSSKFKPFKNQRIYIEYLGYNLFGSMLGMNGKKGINRVVKVLHLIELIRIPKA